MKKYGFGVDIGGTTCKIGLFEMNGTLIEDWEIKTNTENKGASILDDVAVAIEGKMQSAGIAKEETCVKVFFNHKSYLKYDSILKFTKVKTCKFLNFFKSVNKCISVNKKFS